MNLSAPLGALCAALVGALATLLGLLISKENKTSEFRQEWINKLREEITQFLVNINSIRDATHIKYSDISTKLSILGPLYAGLNEAAFKISLRINPDEPEGQAVLKSLNDIQKLSSDEKMLVDGDLRRLESELLINSKDLLKKEWVRVKDGEPVFRGVRRVALVATPLLLLFVIIGGAISLKASTTDSNESKVPQAQNSQTTHPGAPVPRPTLVPKTASPAPIRSGGAEKKSVGHEAQQ